jgi:hypothetical protein
MDRFRLRRATGSAKASKVASRYLQQRERVLGTGRRIAAQIGWATTFIAKVGAHRLPSMHLGKINLVGAALWRANPEPGGTPQGIPTRISGLRPRHKGALLHAQGNLGNDMHRLARVGVNGSSCPRSHREGLRVSVSVETYLDRKHADTANMPIDVALAALGFSPLVVN